MRSQMIKNLRKLEWKALEKKGMDTPILKIPKFKAEEHFKFSKNGNCSSAIKFDETFKKSPSDELSLQNFERNLFTPVAKVPQIPSPSFLQPPKVSSLLPPPNIPSSQSNSIWAPIKVPRSDDQFIKSSSLIPEVSAICEEDASQIQKETEPEPFFKPALNKKISDPECDTSPETILDSVQEEPSLAAQLEKRLYYDPECSNSRVKTKKATHGGRSDVVYKTLFRAFRSYLNEKFSLYKGKSKFSSIKNGCNIFKRKIELFGKNFSEKSKITERIFGSGHEGQKYFIGILSIFLEDKCYYIHKSEEVKEASKVFKEYLKGPTKTRLTKLVEVKEIQLFAGYFYESGFFSEVSTKRENIKLNKDRYEEAIESIMNYGNNGQLIS